MDDSHLEACENESIQSEFKDKEISRTWHQYFVMRCVASLKPKSAKALRKRMLTTGRWLENELKSQGNIPSHS